MNFVAIDFETANRWRNSACSVAIVEVVDGQIAGTFCELIKPPGMAFDAFNVKLHGITPEMVADKPRFAELWPQMEEKLAGRVVVAHNAQFDMGVLRESLRYSHIPAPGFIYLDTVAMSRIMWPQLENHKLNTVAEHLNIKFKHHDAAEDARVCAAIPIRAGQERRKDDVLNLAKSIGLAVKKFLA